MVVFGGVEKCKYWFSTFDPKLMEIYWIFFYSLMNLQQQLSCNLCGNTNEAVMDTIMTKVKL